MAATRRLAAILAADAVGYSRLIGADEPGTLRRLKAIRAELIDPAVERHNGRIVKTTGDGLLIEFGSAVDALRCATEVQGAMVSAMPQPRLTTASSSASAYTMPTLSPRMATSSVMASISRHASKRCPSRAAPAS